MGFLEQLRRYLERVGRAPEGLPSVEVDIAAHRRFLFTAIERRWAGDAEGAKRAYEKWNQGRRFEGIVWSLAARILETFEPAAGAQLLGSLIDVGIGITLDARRPDAVPTATTGSSIKDELLYEMVTGAFYSKDTSRVDEWQFPPRYAFEMRLVQRRGENVILSRCGRTFLETPGLDALRWLLALEAVQSMGPGDGMRLSPELAAYLTEYAQRHETTLDEPDEWRFSWATVRRLAAFGLLTYHVDDDPDSEYVQGYEIIERHLQLLEDIGQRRATPHAILADALLRDETAAIVERAHPDTARMVHENAAATFALQARMVVHEIRNALVPAQIAFRRAREELPASMQRQNARIDHGIQRALDFVDNMLRVANLGVEPPSTFDVDGALRDACSSLSRELNGGFQQEIEASGVSVTGPRPRFILAVTNLLRNAAQSIAGAPDGKVSISTELDANDLLIHVDDSGSGVPQDQRRAIFEPGVTLRPGGSGQGLALVRQVVEGEMRGTVVCTDGPLGGARFSLRIPSKPSRST